MLIDLRRKKNKTIISTEAKESFDKIFNSSFDLQNTLKMHIRWLLLNMTYPARLVEH